MELLKATKIEIEKTYNFLLDQYLQECEPEVDFAPYGNGYVQSGYEYLDQDICWAKEKVCEEIERDFEAYNNWIFEDVFESEEEYEKAKKLIIKYIKTL